VLRAREELKDQFRLKITTYGRRENNPIKFSANTEDALHNLLVRHNPAYLEPVEAFEGAFDDLRIHQMAMLAGLRAGYEAMLASSVVVPRVSEPAPLTARQSHARVTLHNGPAVCARPLLVGGGMQEQAWETCPAGGRGVDARPGGRQSRPGWSPFADRAQALSAEGGRRVCQLRLLPAVRRREEGPG